MRWLRCGVVAVTAASVTWPLAGAAAQSTRRPAEAPLETAARAAAEVPFTGTLVVQWTDGPVLREERLEVEGMNGSMVAYGGTQVMASSTQRLVARGDQWNLLWLGSSSDVSRPAIEGKYELVELPPATVAERPVRVVEAREQGTVVERLSLDQATGLLLRREHYEAGAAPDRVVTFESITIGVPGRRVEPPSRVVGEAPRVVSAPQPAGVSAPDALAGGYLRVGVFRKSGVVQARYSDGLFDLSVFEQDGRLDRSHLPAGERLTIGPLNGWHYEWAGGHVVIWQRSGTVFTAVSDAPLDDVVSAVASLPPATARVPFVSRLRQVCRTLVQPFGFS